VTNIRWRIVLLLFIAGFINYLDRSALSVAAPTVAKDLNLSPASLGLVFSTFFIGYAAFNFIGGWAADRWGGKNVFSGAILIWSVLCGATGLATGFGSLLAVRTFFGRGSAGNNHQQDGQQLVPAPGIGNRIWFGQLRPAIGRRCRGPYRRVHDR